MLNIYKASAGSGKTYRLVLEYIKLLFGDKTADGKFVLRNPKTMDREHRHILAITFTNKATNEMKERILVRLDELADESKSSEYMDDLTETFGVKEGQIREVASKAYQELLEDYTNFNVSTIDTFFQKVLRTFTFEMDIAGNYGVELSDDIAVGMGVTALKGNMRRGNTVLNKRVEHFVTENIKEGKSWNVFRPGTIAKTSIYDFAKTIFKEEVKQNAEALVEYIDDPKKLSLFLEQINKSISEDLLKQKEAAKCLLKSCNPNSDLKSGYRKALEFLADDANTMPIKDSDFNSGNNDKFQKRSKFVDISGLTDKIAALQRSISPLKMIRDNAYKLGLISEISRGMQQYMRGNDMVLLSDTNDLIRRIINGCDLPFLYERVGMKIRHFLIDEFQDTSKMQWTNFMPLIEHGISNNDDSLIIGDVKQSIYRFRNSDPMLLDHEVENAFRGKTHLDTFKDNHRSGKLVVDFNNRFFEYLAEELSLSSFYSDVKQTPQKNFEGHVFVRRIEESSDDDFKNMSLSKMIADIRSLMNRGYRLKDIAILVNTNNEGRIVINRIIEENDESLAVVSEESLLVSSAPSVRITVGILSMLANKKDEATPMPIPIIIKRIEELKMQGKGIDEAFAEAIAVKEYVPDSNYDSQHTIDMLVEAILGSLPVEMVKNDSAFVQAFMDELIDFSVNYGSDIRTFLKWWEKKSNTLSISSPENKDAIRVLTIHKSKGLEYPCVLLPLFSWDFDKDATEWLVVDDELREKLGTGDNTPPIIAVERKGVGEGTILESHFKRLYETSVLDSLNKTYVACTRAVSELIITIRKGDSADLGQLTEKYIFTMNGIDADEWEAGKKTQAVNPKPAEEVVEMPDYEANPNGLNRSYAVPETQLDIDGSPREKGVMLHALMEKVHDAKPESINRAVMWAVSRGYILNSTVQTHKDNLKKWIDNRPDWFAIENKVIVERTMMTKEHGVTRQYRADRIIHRPDGKMIVIDYKFGERNDKKYIAQVRRYMRLIQSVYGNRISSVEGFVWYVETDDAVSVAL